MINDINTFWDEQVHTLGEFKVFDLFNNNFK